MISVNQALQRVHFFLNNQSNNYTSTTLIPLGNFKTKNNVGSTPLRNRLTNGVIRALRYVF